MIEQVIFPVKVVHGEEWVICIKEFSKATIRAIGMDHKPRRVQDEGTRSQ